MGKLLALSSNLIIIYIHKLYFLDFQRGTYKLKGGHKGALIN